MKCQIAVKQLSFSVPSLDNEGDYVEMEPEVTETLVLVPRKMYIRRIIRHKYVLKSKLQVENPDRKTFLIAPLPPAALHKCMADASLLADIIISKYRYHLPFYRVIETYKELGVTISSSTINDWFKSVVWETQTFIRPVANVSPVLRLCSGR